jgi:hypothetical protein
MLMRRIAPMCAAVALAAIPLAAGAGVYETQLEFRANNGVAQRYAAEFGNVLIEDGFDNGTSVRVLVTLADADSLFVNTGGPHEPFLYNLVSAADVTVINALGQNFFDGGRSDPAAFEATPFGVFTNKIGCCSTWIPEQQVVSGWHWEGSGRSRHKVLNYVTVPAHWVENNGSANGIHGPLEFYLHDDAGLTFAGVGATFDADGRLVTLGTGNHFYSNAGRWWFTADICDGAASGACTYNVAGRDAYRTHFDENVVVPEPAPWAMMIVGLGGAGGLLRRRRAATR